MHFVPEITKNTLLSLGLHHLCYADVAGKIIYANAMTHTANYLLKPEMVGYASQATGVAAGLLVTYPAGAYLALMGSITLLFNHQHIVPTIKGVIESASCTIKFGANLTCVAGESIATIAAYTAEGAVSGATTIDSYFSEEQQNHVVDQGYEEILLGANLHLVAEVV